MPATLSITNGSTTVNLITTGSSLMLRPDGYIQREPEPNQIRRQSAYEDGSGLVSSRVQNVIETYTVNIKGTSHDNLSANLQALADLQREARNYHTTRWQTTPVYLQAKTSAETNTRYSLVFDIRSNQRHTFYDNLIFEPNSLIRDETITIEREPYWRSNPPSSSAASPIALIAPQAPATQADSTQQWITNYRDLSVLSHVFNKEVSGSVFSGNLIDNPSLYYWSGSTAETNPATGDEIYLGSTCGMPRNIILSVCPNAAGGTYTVNMEFSSSTVFTTAGMQSRNQTFANLFLQETTGSVPQPQLLTVACAPFWSPSSVNGVTAYWLRARVSGYVSGCAPQQMRQTIYSVNDCFVEVASSVIQGDVDALALIRLCKFNAGISTSISPFGIRWAAMGMKSRGLTNFTSRLNFAGHNPGDWSTCFGQDTAASADMFSPGGSRVHISFATSGSMLQRAIIETTSASIVKDFLGEYNVYIRCMQTGGSSGGTKIKAQLIFGKSFGSITSYTQETKTVALTTFDQGQSSPEIVNLGKVSIIAPNIYAHEGNRNGLSIRLFAQQVTGTPALRLYDIVLIPTDEWAMAANHTGNTYQVVGAAAGEGLDIDSGLFRHGITYKTTASESSACDCATVISPFEMRGRLPTLPPGKRLQIHFLLGDYVSPLTTSPSILVAPDNLGGYVRIWIHERWNYLRGNE